MKKLDIMNDEHFALVFGILGFLMGVNACGTVLALILIAKGFAGIGLFTITLVFVVSMISLFLLKRVTE